MGRRRRPEWQTRQTIRHCCSLQMKQVRELQVAEKKRKEKLKQVRELQVAEKKKIIESITHLLDAH
jgi:hypothetical protein